jgi:hypothetical protein
MTPDLAPGSQQTYVASVTVEACNDVHYTLEADYQDTINEYDESDNVAGVTIEPHHISGASTLGGSFGTLGGCNGPDLAQFEHMLEQEGGLDGLLEHKLEGLNYEQWGTDNRGNDMDIGPGAPILDRLED